MVAAPVFSLSVPAKLQEISVDWNNRGYIMKTAKKKNKEKGGGEGGIQQCLVVDVKEMKDSIPSTFQ